MLYTSRVRQEGTTDSGQGGRGGVAYTRGIESTPARTTTASPREERHLVVVRPTWQLRDREAGALSRAKAAPSSQRASQRSIIGTLGTRVGRKARRTERACGAASAHAHCHKRLGVPSCSSAGADGGRTQYASLSPRNHSGSICASPALSHHVRSPPSSDGRGRAEREQERRDGSGRDRARLLAKRDRNATVGGVVV